jgi:hypothetical protein
MIEEISTTEIIITWAPRQRFCLEVFLIPQDGFEHPGMQLSFMRAEEQYLAQLHPKENILLHLSIPQTTVSLQKVVMPIPTVTTSTHHNGEHAEELKALGYQE